MAVAEPVLVTLAAMFLLLVLIVVVAIKRRPTRPIELRPARAPGVRPSHVASTARVARGSKPPFRPDNTDQLPVIHPRTEEKTEPLPVFQPRGESEESSTVIVDHDQLYGPR
jgi:hypothetical protein